MTDQPSPEQPTPAPGASGPPPGYPPYPYAYAPPINMYAILALVFGAMVFPPVGIYFGYKAKQQIAQTGERGIELANAGLIVGWIFTILYLVFSLIWCGIMGTIFAGAVSNA